MNILVTGGAGFIGSNIVDAYINEGYEVSIIDSLVIGQEKHVNPNATFYNVNICSKEFIDIVEKIKPDIISHHAAQIDVQTSVKNPVYDGETNIIGTINVLEAAKRTKSKLIYASSAAVYGTPMYLGIDEEHCIAPLSPYGVSKHTPEHYIEIYHKLFDLEYTIFRYANAYGQRQDSKGEGGVISILIEKAIKNDLFTIYGDGEQTRDFVHVSDIVNANLLATKKMINNTINIGTGKPNSLNIAIKTLEDIMGKKIRKLYSEFRPGDIKHSYYNINRAEKLINWAPKIEISEGIKQTYDYYVKNN